MESYDVTNYIETGCAFVACPCAGCLAKKLTFEWNEVTESATTQFLVMCILISSVFDDVHPY